MTTALSVCYRTAHVHHYQRYEAVHKSLKHSMFMSDQTKNAKSDRSYHFKNTADEPGKPKPQAEALLAKAPQLA